MNTRRALPLALLLCGCAANPSTRGPSGVVPGDPPLHYETVGSGPALIIVLHGGPGVTHDYLRPEWDRLASVGEVVYYDQRGCGANPANGALTWQEHVADLDRLIRTLRHGRPVFLAGSSWGSELALRYAYLRPGSADALVLSGYVGWPGPVRMRRWLVGAEGFDPLNMDGTPGQQGRSDRQSFPSAADFSQADLLNPMGLRSTPVWSPDRHLPRALFGFPLQGDTAQLGAEIRARVQRVVEQYGAVSLRRSADPNTGQGRVYAMPPSDVGNDSTLAWRFPMICHESGVRTGSSRSGPPLSALASIETPTLAVSGGEGIHPDASGQLVGILPNLEVDSIPGGGHDPWYTQTDAFFEIVSQFLRERLRAVE